MISMKRFKVLLVLLPVMLCTACSFGGKGSGAEKLVEMSYDKFKEGIDTSDDKFLGYDCSVSSSDDSYVLTVDFDGDNKAADKIDAYFDKKQLKDVPVAEGDGVSLYLLAQEGDVAEYARVSMDSDECVIDVSWEPYSEAAYAVKCAGIGFDSIDGEQIDLDDIASELRDKLDDSELYDYYMLAEHGLDVENSVIDDSPSAILKAGVLKYGWDSERNEFADLSGYEGSAEVYLAVEHNLNADTGEEFADNKEMAMYLNGVLPDSRAWIWDRTGYDGKTGQEVSAEIQDILTAYEGYAKGHAVDGDKALYLLFINDDPMPEMLYCNGDANAPMTLCTYVNGAVAELRMVNDVIYIPKSGLFIASGGVPMTDFYSDALFRFDGISLQNLMEGNYGSEYIKDTSFRINTPEKSETVSGVVEYNDRFTKAVDYTQLVDAYHSRGTTGLEAYANLLEYMEAGKQPLPNADEYILPESSIRFLSPDEVRALSPEQMRIARNEIFARHGYEFQSEDLREYFSSKSWYHPGQDYDGQNRFEECNAYMISVIENGG